MLDSYGRVTLDQRVDLDVTTFARTAPSPGSADQTGASASFWSPFGISADATGNTCVADYQNHTIQEISPGGTVTTLAGNPGVGGSADGTGSAARFSSAHLRHDLQAANGGFERELALLTNQVPISLIWGTTGRGCASLHRPGHLDSGHARGSVKRTGPAATEPWRDL